MTRRPNGEDDIEQILSQTSLLNITFERVYTTPVSTPHPAQNKSLKTLHILQHAQLAYTLAHYRRKRRPCDVSGCWQCLWCHEQAPPPEINERAPCTPSTSIKEHLHFMQRTQDKQLSRRAASATQPSDRSTDKWNGYRMDPTGRDLRSHP